MIETERLLLRPFRPDDAVELHAIWGDPGNERFVGDWQPPATLAETRQRLEPILEEQELFGFSLWAVVERESGRLVGDCGLFLPGGLGPDVELAYGLGRAWWGRGYATEAAHAFLRRAWEELDLDRVVADVEPANDASRRVLEKIGMALVGESEGKLLYAATNPLREV